MIEDMRTFCVGCRDKNIKFQSLQGSNGHFIIFYLNNGQQKKVRGTVPMKMTIQPMLVNPMLIGSQGNF